MVDHPPSSAAVRVLIVENTAEPLHAVTQTLRLHGGFEYQIVETADEALQRVQHHVFDIILIDIGLPKMTGSDLCERLKTDEKTSRIPILLMARELPESSHAPVLVTGGYERIVNPMNPMDLTAQIMLALRSRHAADHLSFGAGTFALLPATHSVRVEGHELRLSAKEFDLLAMLLRSPGEAVSRDDISRVLWERPASETSRHLDVHIWSLRSKLGDHGRSIESVGKSGYRFRAVS